MKKLYLGIELNDYGCNLTWFNPETKTVQKMSDQSGSGEIPAYLCLDVSAERWYAGREAEEAAGREGCIVLNRLVSLFYSGQNLHVNGRSYTAEDMMQEFMAYILKEAEERSGLYEIGSLVICLDKVEILQAEQMNGICGRLGINPADVHILNRQECFMYYLMSQKREIWSNVSILFDYSREGLCCYEASLLKGLRPVTVQACMEAIAEAPSAELLKEDEESKKTVDRWFSALAEKKMSGKIVSSVMLCGEGFLDISWAREFIRTISSQKSRKVYQTDVLYGMGAAFAAYHIAEKHRNFPYCCICDGRISTTVSLFTDEQQGSEQLILIQAGTNCHEARVSLNLNLIRQNRLILFLRNTGAREGYKLPIDLSSFMEDGRERTKIRLSIVFIKSDTMIVKIKDLGFGEIYPSTGRTLEQSYNV